MSNCTVRYYQGRNLFGSAINLDKKRARACPSFAAKECGHKEFIDDSEDGGEDDDGTDNGQKVTATGDLDTSEVKNTMKERRVQKYEEK